MLLVKDPPPAPLVVRLLDIVGLALVLQQTPFAVIVPSPVDVTLPPQVAVVAVMLETAAVVTVGRLTLVVNDTCDP